MRAILTLNAGSGTIKFSVFNFECTEQDYCVTTIKKIYSGLVDKVNNDPNLKIFQISETTKKVIFEKNLADEFKQKDGDPYEFAILYVLNWLKQNDIEIVAAGHRVTHGGIKYQHATIATPEIAAYLETLIPLTPLHQPHNLKGYKILQAKFPKIMQVFCFDTSFHTTCNKLSQTFAIPKKLTEEGIRRYGFHGLSYEYIVSKFPEFLPKEKINGKIIVAHLGQGASMCAIEKQKSVATTLSFTALDGLPMGTRCGSFDPGAMLYLMEHYQMDHDKLEHLLYKESGLLGVSGISSDMRELLESNHPDAKFAVDLFNYKTAAWIGMLAAELHGLEVLIFTAGIGENASLVREKICEHAAWLGVKIDPAKNAKHGPEISTPDSKVKVFVIPTDEEMTIAKSTFAYLKNL